MTSLCSGENLKQLLTAVEKELNILRNWLGTNTLSLNCCVSSAPQKLNTKSKSLSTQLRERKKILNQI